MARSLMIASPYDNDCLNMIANYEKSNNLDGTITKQLIRIRAVTEESMYEKSNMTSNEINQFIFLRDGNKLVAGCHFQGYRDLRDAYLSILPSTSSRMTANLLQYATTYAFESLGMEQVFAEIDNHDEKNATALIDANFESLGPDGKKTQFMIEKGNYVMTEGLQNGNSKKH